MDVLVNQMGEVLSQYVCTSNHHDIHFKYLSFICQLYPNTADIFFKFLIIPEKTICFYILMRKCSRSEHKLHCTHSS